MWHIEGASVPGGVRELRFNELENHPLDSRWVAEVARSVVAQDDIAVPWHLVDFYAERPDVPFANAIPAWGNVAEEQAAAAMEKESMSPFRFETVGGGLNMAMSEGDLESWVFARHDETAVAVAVPPEKLDAAYYSIHIQYDDEFRRPSPLPHEEQDVFFEYRFYQGRNSAVFDGVVPFLRHGGRRMVRLLAHGGGLLVGTVVRLACRGPRTFKHDPIWRWNLNRLESAHPDATSQYPRATHGTNSGLPSCIVLVHGTFSCGIKIARELTALKPCVPVYRFEHDTFLPIEENARELAKILENLGSQRVLLVGHSRGGLVAAAAALHLQLGRHPIGVELWTYGTPHAGTPLVEGGSKVLGWLYRLGADLVSGVPVPPPLQAAMSYFLGTAALPPGISAMDPDGAAITTHQSHLDYVNLVAYGGVIDPTLTKQTTSAAGFQIGLARTMFAGRKNDLVVPIDSSCWKGGQQPIRDCGHGQYFEQPTVLHDIESFGCA